MTAKIWKHPYTKALQEDARRTAPSDETLEKILGGVLVAAGVTTAAISVAPVLTAAAAQSAVLARNAFIKAAGSITAAAVGTAAAGVVGVALVVAPAIDTVTVLKSDNFADSCIVIEVDSAFEPRAVQLLPSSGNSDENLSATLREDGCYEVVVTRNDSYLVQVIGQGGQVEEQRIVVDCIDADIPTLQSYVVENNQLKVFFTDNLSGIDWNTIFIRDASGVSSAPITYSAEDGFAIFPLPDKPMQICVGDLAGNQAVCEVTITEG